MGMSASQARLISLTERMNDIEYQGQQINQQRTTLSNQVNALYNQLLEMSVPVPPSTQDFTKVVYSGITGASRFTVGNVVPTGKNGSGHDTYSVDFKYNMAGHAVSKNNHSAIMKNTSHYLKYSDASSIVQSLYDPDRQVPKLGEAVTKISTSASGDDGDNILLKISAEDYSKVMGNNTVQGVFAFDENNELVDVTDKVPSTGDIYIKCNKADLRTEPFKELAQYTEIPPAEGSEATEATVQNVFMYAEETKKGGLSAFTTDEKVARLNLWADTHNGNKEEAPEPIKTVEQLLSVIQNSQRIIKRDESGDIELTNPNYNAKNPSALSVGDYPVLEMESREAQEALGISYNDYITALCNSFPEYDEEDIASKFLVYIEKTSSGSQIPHFIKEDEMGALNNNDEQTIRTYEYDEDGTYTKTENKLDCEMEFDSATGRITKVGIPDGKGGIDWIELIAETITDDKAYNDAFNEYEYKKHLYDQQQKEINAKTSIVQAEDKSLELKLTRLDNERNAVNTEIEAVKKVVNDNIEKSFKTFSG